MKKINKENTLSWWREQIKAHNAFPFIKPNGGKHESGYGTFDVGYIILNNKQKCKKKIVLGTISDAIHLSSFNDKNCIHLDVSLDGYIRILGSSYSYLIWESENNIYSDAMITTIKKLDELIK